MSERVEGEILGELFGIFMRVECLMLNKAVAMWKAKLEMPHFNKKRDSHSRVNEGRNFKTLSLTLLMTIRFLKRGLFEYFMKYVRWSGVEKASLLLYYRKFSK